MLNDEQIEIERQVLKRALNDAPIASTYIDAICDQAKALPKCACQEPWTLGVVHRANEPCYWPDRAKSAAGGAEAVAPRLNVRHPDCHKAADAFWKYWRENGDTHKHGYYESTWGAINAALKLVGVVTTPIVQACRLEDRAMLATDAGQELVKCAINEMSAHPSVAGMPDEQLARLFHDTYEELAPNFGYVTRQETRQFDPLSPNGRLMIAVCARVRAIGGA